MLDLPTLHLNIERDRVTQVGMNARDVAQSVLVSLSGSFQTAPNFWLNPNNGVSYQVAVQSPQYRVTSLQDLMNTPVNDPSVPNSQVLSNLVQLTPVVRPAVVSHYNVLPVIDVYASTQDRDLGGVIRDVNKVLQPFRKQLPRGTQLTVRGQVVTMESSFIGLGVGLLAAIVLVYFLIVVNFQSWLDPFIIITALPGASGGYLLDAAAHPHHAQRAIADGRGNVHGSGDCEFDLDDLIRARPDAGRNSLGPGCLGSRLYAYSPGADDCAGHDYRHAADVAGLG